MESRITQLTIILLIVAAMNTGCSKETENRKPGQFAPGRSLQQITISRPRNDAQPLIPAPNQGRSNIGAGVDNVGPFVRVLRKGAPVTDGVFTGTIVLEDSNLFLLETNRPPGTRDTISVGFALPKGITLPTIHGTVTLTVRDSSSLAGANQEVFLCSKSGLHIGFIWKAVKDTITLSTGCGQQMFPIVLQQVSLPRGFLKREDAYYRVEVKAGFGPLTINAPIGKIFTFGDFKGFIRTSAYRTVSDRGRDVREGYILRALVTRR